jgi:hypothetical protein
MAQENHASKWTLRGQNQLGVHSLLRIPLALVTFIVVLAVVLFIDAPIARASNTLGLAVLPVGFFLAFLVTRRVVAFIPVDGAQDVVVLSEDHIEIGDPRMLLRTAGDDARPYRGGGPETRFENRDCVREGLPFGALRVKLPNGLRLRLPRFVTPADAAEGLANDLFSLGLQDGKVRLFTLKYKSWVVVPWPGERASRDAPP